jgi:hypothetical protein
MLAAVPARDRPAYVLDRIDRLLPEPLWEAAGWTADGG